MGRQTSRARRAATARERAAALRAEQEARERRRRLMLVLGSTVGLIAVIAVILVAGKFGGNSTSSGPDRFALPAGVLHDVTGVPATTLDTVGKGDLSSMPKAVTGQPLTANGKPEVLYIGAEFCPYCAAERWALVQALSRFGTFSGLQGTRSASNDSFPNTATFTFTDATYTSSTVAFVAREVEDRNGHSLDQPTSEEQRLWLHYTGQGSFPFLDIAEKYVVDQGASFDPTLLKGLTVSQIAAQLADPNSPVAKAIDGTANVLTAAICKATGGLPGDVCTAAGVVAATQALSG